MVSARRLAAAGAAFRKARRATLRSMMSLENPSAVGSADVLSTIFYDLPSASARACDPSAAPFLKGLEVGEGRFEGLVGKPARGEAPRDAHRLPSEVEIEVAQSC